MGEGNCTTGDMRLADYTDSPEGSTRSGQLQVCVNEAWGAVCSDPQFGYAEMAVACSHMGFSTTGEFFWQICVCTLYHWCTIRNRVGYVVISLNRGIFLTRLRKLLILNVFCANVPSNKPGSWERPSMYIHIFLRARFLSK